MHQTYKTNLSTTKEYKCKKEACVSLHDVWEVVMKNGSKKLEKTKINSYNL